MSDRFDKNAVIELVHGYLVHKRAFCTKSVIASETGFPRWMIDYACGVLRRAGRVEMLFDDSRKTFWGVVRG